MPAEQMQLLLRQIYGSESSSIISERLHGLIEGYRSRIPRPKITGLRESDALLIAYPDQVQKPGQAPLATLDEFAQRRLHNLISIIHLLPFYPWSSDDGFAVIDYRQVATEYGTWEDVRRLAEHFRLMFDGVINHVSAESRWFKEYLQDNDRYQKFFISIDGRHDLSAVVRPRTLPLLTSFKSEQGERAIWTTFGPDQIDLNYENPDVLLEMLDVILFYVTQGAQMIRLDAVAYLWKEIGTSCIHLHQTHLLVQFLRAVLNKLAPHVMLVTETNVPQQDNLTYFGDGLNEANLIYNFPLPPLVLHAFQTGRAETLGRWANSVRPPSAQATFLNFLASHDGIGLNPVRGILSEEEILKLAQQVVAGGGLVSEKSNTDGTKSAYELNVNYFDALDAVAESVAENLRLERFVTAHAILLSFIGVPAIYFHSMFGSRGWPKGVEATGRSRAINREKLQEDLLETELADATSLRSRAFRRLGQLLRVRSRQSAFAPQAVQRIPDRQGNVLALVRENQETEKSVLCLYNLTPEAREVRLDQDDMHVASLKAARDLISGNQYDARALRPLTLQPYQALWLAAL